MIEVRTGHPVSSDSVEAVNLYQDAVDRILGSESGAADTLDRAIELDEDFALAAAARYYLAKDAGEPGADVHRDRAERSVLQASDWERQHVEMVIGLLDQPGATLDRAEAYLRTTPADMLVVSLLTGNRFFYGGPTKQQAVLSIFESVQEALGDDWAFLARLGFAASEAGQRERGRELIERALAIRPQSLFSIHALAHMLHDDGAAEESARQLDDWLRLYGPGARDGQMYGHVQWHLALAEFQTGEREAAMQRYLAYCSPATTTCGPVLTLADCGGFLLRDYLQSGLQRPLDGAVTRHIERVWGMIGHPFIALHVAALYATAGDLSGLKHCEEAIQATPEGANRDVSLALVHALRDHVAGDYPGALQTLATLSPGARIGIGGSNVERILVDLVEASSQRRH
ncbi:hypothetical protein [Halomonas aquatica]|uniref:Tetratricopeptide repeat protein 38 n=1 Tax=Halomonas aquatica TaxID=3151123 RepID=A0ABV1NIF1_9GAMM